MPETRRASAGESAVRAYFGTFANLRSLTPPKRRHTHRVQLKCSPREIDEHSHFRELERRDLALLPAEEPERPPQPSTMITLAAQIKKLHSRKKRLPSTSVNAIMYQLTRAVAHAAGLGVSHGQVTPANVTIRIPPLLVELTGWDAEPSQSSWLYSAPELFLSPESVIEEHMKADVWSLGMVLIEALNGTPLVKGRHPIHPHEVLGQTMKAIGTPSDAALAILDPTLGCNSSMWKVLPPKPWREVLLKGIPADVKLTLLLDRMLDWNPATREPAVSLLCFPYFAASRTTSCKYRSAERLYYTIDPRYIFYCGVSQVCHNAPAYPTRAVRHHLACVRLPCEPGRCRGCVAITRNRSVSEAQLLAVIGPSVIGRAPAEAFDFGKARLYHRLRGAVAMVDSRGPSWRSRLVADSDVIVVIRLEEVVLKVFAALGLKVFAALGPTEPRRHHKCIAESGAIGSISCLAFRWRQPGSRRWAVSARWGRPAHRQLNFSIGSKFRWHRTTGSKLWRALALHLEGGRIGDNDVNHREGCRFLFVLFLGGILGVISSGQCASVTLP
jgi:hypothetical protein